MSKEIDQIKNDLETIQKALGLLPAAGRDWIQWMQRDRWFSLWWCLPGLILTAAALLPTDPNVRHYGLVLGQWAGILTAASLLGIAIVHARRVSAKDGRPEALIREEMRGAGMTAQGYWFGVGLLLQVLLYFLWGWRYQIDFTPFWSGLFLLMGSTCLITALTARAWTLLGYALPFMAYGASVSLVPGHNKVNGVLFGLMFVAIALCFTFIHAARIRQARAEHEAN